MGIANWLRVRSGVPRSQRPGFRPRLEALEGRDVPSTLKVTSTADSGPGSLRAAIAAANSSTTIIFDPSLDFKTITLTGGELNITNSLSIEGPGRDLLTVSGSISRVFEVAAKKKVSISGLTISNGFSAEPAGISDDGGGILNHGTLTVNSCTLSGNTADSGGGISNELGGTLTMSNCLLSGNSARLGGGVANESMSTLTMSFCTLSDNIADSGGGIYNQQSSATLRNCTVSHNDATGWAGGGAGGGIYDIGGNLTVNSCTLSVNICYTVGGGIYTIGAGTVTVTKSMFISNESFGSTTDNIYGPYVDGGGNTFS